MAAAEGPGLSVRSARLRRRRHRRGLEKRANALKSPRGEREVGIRAPLLALHDAGVEQLLDVVADRGLLEAEEVLEVADANGLAAGGEQAVEDLHAVAVGERLEDPLELARLVLGEGGAGERGAALDEGKRGRHGGHHIEKT